MAIPRLNGWYGRGSSQPIPLHNVLCNGREDSLINCTFRPRPFAGVTHANDAGVDCFTKQARGRGIVGKRRERERERETIILFK